MYSMTKPDYGKGKFQGNVSLSINYLLFGGGGGCPKSVTQHDKGDQKDKIYHNVFYGWTRKENFNNTQYEYNI